MHSTIAISKELKDKIKKLGYAGESYEDVIARMYEFTRKAVLQQFLYETNDSISIDEALAQAKKQWPA